MRGNVSVFLVAAAALLAPNVAFAQTDDSLLQAELAAVGFFGVSGELSPGARAGAFLRPWDQLGMSAGALVLSTTTESSLGPISGLRFAGDLSGTIQHVSDSITSSASAGVRLGSASFEVDGLSSGRELYAQVVLRGRGEWAFARHWYVPFQMEIAFALLRADLKVNGVVADEVHGLEADLSLGIGYRF